MVLRIFRHEWAVAVAIFCIALALRVPYIGEPREVMFDEGLYATFTMATDHGRPFFDIHPPLPKLIYAALINGTEYRYRTITDVATPFEDFPFVRLRVFTALIGSLLPVALYMLSLAFFRERIYALCSAVLAVFDPALLLYARTFLPDSLLLLTGMGGLALIIWGERKSSRVLFVAGALVIGSACSIKLTGIGFIGAAIWYLLAERKIAKAIGVLAATLLVYVACFSAFFYLFTPEVMHVSQENEAYLHNVPFPEHTIRAVVPFVWTYTRLQYFANRDYHGHKFSSAMYEWPFGHKAFAFWNRDGRIIRLMSNPVSWSLAAITVLFASAAYAVSKISGKIFFEKPVSFFLVAYWGNMLPFLLVPRGMFLYHYFPALLFAFVLIPPVLAESRFIAKEYERKVLVGICVTTIAVSAVLAFLFIYRS